MIRSKRINGSRRYLISRYDVKGFRTYAEALAHLRSWRLFYARQPMYHCEDGTYIQVEC